MRSAEWLLACAGLAAILYCAVVWGEARRSERVASAFGRRTGLSAGLPAETLAVPPTVESQIYPSSLDRGSIRGESRVIGRIEIPNLDLTAPITEGIEDSDLRHGVGHIPGTAVPGGLGTMGLAGHRDTYFRRLRRVRNGMQIIVTGSAGAYRYRIDSTEIVLPEQVEVLDVADRPGLALVTCYPFEYIGAAPRRFIVHAHLLSVAPDTE